VAKLTDKVSRLRQGQDDARYRFDVGAMALAAQRDIVRRHVEEAVAAGARVTMAVSQLGWASSFNRLCSPISISLIVHDEETFGPTLRWSKWRTRRGDPIANDSTTGFRRQCGPATTRGPAVARQLEVGRSTSTTRWQRVHLPCRCPLETLWIGARNGGADGLLKYCRAQAITTPRIPTRQMSRSGTRIRVGSSASRWARACERSARSATDRYRSARRRK